MIQKSAIVKRFYEYLPVSGFLEGKLTLFRFLSIDLGFFSTCFFFDSIRKDPFNSSRTITSSIIGAFRFQSEGTEGAPRRKPSIKADVC
jgi:hypothetical protein